MLDKKDTPTHTCDCSTQAHTHMHIHQQVLHTPLNTLAKPKLDSQRVQAVVSVPIPLSSRGGGGLGAGEDAPTALS